MEIQNRESPDQNKKLTVIFSAIFLLLLLSELETAFLVQFYKQNLIVLAASTFSPLSGHAWYRAFQNRLLPAGIMSLFHANNIVNTYKLFILFFTFICNFLIYFLFNKLGNKKALVMTFLFSLAFLLFQDRTWLYGWDLIYTAVTVFLLIGIDSNLPNLYFIFIFIIALFNHESALFIPAWMLITAFPKNKLRLVESIILLAAGTGIIFFLRSMLFKGSPLISVGIDQTHKILGNHFCLFDNFNYLFTYPGTDNFSSWHYDFIPIVIFITYIFSLRLWKDQKFRSVLIYSGILILAVLLFANIYETRVWLPIIPALLYLNSKDLFIEKVTPRYLS